MSKRKADTAIRNFFWRLTKDKSLGHADQLRDDALFFILDYVGLSAGGRESLLKALEGKYGWVLDKPSSECVKPRAEA